MAGALNMLVIHFGVVPVVPERPFQPRVLEGLPGDALLGCWLPRHGVSVLASSPCPLDPCILCLWDADLFPQKSIILNLWNPGLVRRVEPQDVLLLGYKGAV